jgi:hypothetical protein
VTQSRKKIGFPLKSFAKHSVQKCISDWEKAPEEISKEFNENILNYIIGFKDYKYSSIVYNQVPFIVNYGCIFLPLLQPIRIIPSYPDYMLNNTLTYLNEKQIQYSSLNINIPYKTSVNEIKKFFDYNNDVLSNKLSKLPENEFKIKEKEYKILKLHEKHSYKKIAEKSSDNHSREAIRQAKHNKNIP